MTDEERADYIRHLVDQAPPLTEGQRETVASALRRRTAEVDQRTERRAS